jgi:hypothetical protein
VGNNSCMGHLALLSICYQMDPFCSNGHMTSALNGNDISFRQATSDVGHSTAQSVRLYPGHFVTSFRS